MTLTEEQQAAIKIAIKYIPNWPSARKENCAVDVLRAMIDSSGTVEPTGGFDLEKARAADEALPYPLDANEIWVSGKGQMHINPPNAPSIFFTLSDLCEFRNLFHGQAAEIERLRPFEIAARDLDSDLTKIAGERDDQAARIKSLKKEIRRLKHESKVEQELTNSYIKHLHEAEARIKELKEAHKRSGAKYAKIINELRSSVYANIPGLKKQWDEVLADGKISIGNHIVGPDQMVPCWQITEERMRAIRMAEELAWDCKAVAVLRAMLQEAGL